MKTFLTCCLVITLSACSASSLNSEWVNNDNKTIPNNNPSLTIALDECNFRQHKKKAMEMNFKSLHVKRFRQQRDSEYDEDYQDAKYKYQFAKLKKESSLNQESKLLIEEANICMKKYGFTQKKLSE